MTKYLFLTLILVACTQNSPGDSAPAPAGPSVPPGTAGVGSMTFQEAKVVDPILFGEWHDLSAVNDQFTTIHGVETWSLGEIDGKYLLDRNVFGGDHLKYTVQTNTSVVPHQLTLTVIYDFNAKIVAGTKQLCVYNIAILTQELLTGTLFARYQSLISLPRRMLQLSCSLPGITSFPTTMDNSAQVFHNIDDGFNQLKENSFSQTSTSTIEVPFDSANPDHKNSSWNKEALIDGVRFTIDFTGTSLASATQVYIVHEDGTAILVHDKLATDSGKFFRTVGAGGYPLDTSAWHGKAFGDLDKYRLRLNGFVTTDVPLFRAGIYPTILQLKP